MSVNTKSINGNINENVFNNGIPHVVEYRLSNEKCARCKMLNTFICEHMTSVRDQLHTIYAEEGRFYLNPRNSRKPNTVSTSTSPSTTTTTTTTINVAKMPPPTRIIRNNNEIIYDRPKAASKSPVLKGATNKEPKTRAIVRSLNDELVDTSNLNNQTTVYNLSDNLETHRSVEKLPETIVHHPVKVETNDNVDTNKSREAVFGPRAINPKNNNYISKNNNVNKSNTNNVNKKNNAKDDGDKFCSIV